MGCLYCGKEIGPFRVFRDDEFCSVAHRQKYGERLGKVIGQIGAPEATPREAVAFRVEFPTHTGNPTAVLHPPARGGGVYPMQIARAWPMAIPPVLGSDCRSVLSKPKAAKRAKTISPKMHGAISEPLDLLGPETPEAAISGTNALQFFGDPGPILVEGQTTGSTAKRAGAGVEPQFRGIALRLPTFEPNLRESQLPSSSVAWRGRSKAGEAAKRPVTPGFNEQGLRLPQLRLTAALEVVNRPGESISPSMAAAPAQDAVSSRLEEIAGRVVAIRPPMQGLAVGGTHVPGSGRFAQSPAPEPATPVVAPAFHLEPVAELARIETTLPDVSQLRILEDTPASTGKLRKKGMLAPTPSPVVQAPESMPAAAAFRPLENAPVRLPWVNGAAHPDATLSLLRMRICPAVAGPAPQPVWSMPAFAPYEPAVVVPSAETKLLPVSLSPVADTAIAVSSASTCPAVAGPAAHPVESMPAFPAYEPAAIATVVTMRQPGMRIEPIADGCLAASTANICPAVAGPAPHPLESMPAFPAYVPAVAAMVPQLRLPEPSLGFAGGGGGGLCGAVAGPPAQPVWSMPAFAAYEPAALATVRELHLPSPNLEVKHERTTCAAVSSPAAQPVESMPAFAPYAPAALAQTPEVRMLVADLNAVPDMALAVSSANTCPAVAGPAAQPLESMPAFAAYQPSEMAITPPALHLPWAGEDALPNIDVGTGRATCAAVAGPAAQPVESMPSFPAFVAQPGAAVPPPIRMTAFAMKAVAGSEPLNEAAPGPAAQPVESMPRIAAFVPAALAPTVALHMPQLKLRGIAGCPAAGTQESLPAVMAPEAARQGADVALLRPIALLKVNRLVMGPKEAMPDIPKPKFVAIEFYCQQGAATPHRQLAWQTPELPTALPALNLKLATGREEPTVIRPVVKPRSQKVERPEVVRQIARSRMVGMAQKIAACLLMGAVLWYGVRNVRLSTAPVFGKRTTDLAAGAATEVSSPSGRLPDARSTPSASPGLFARLQGAISDRAATTVSDTMEAGMQAWGTAPKQWAAGWSRNADGYVRPGPLELFKPTSNFKNYRMEFFGQIENKSMGWVVRAQDKQNYYAMKFSVIEQGLRPVIAMVHYPVVGGKKGHSISTPLNVMVHQNRPLHVSVDVDGNRLTASVEGQQVDSWTDDLMPKGGVGFFSDAGEKMRLYWMKVSKNQDWLGTVCSYLSGADSTRETAELWWPRLPSAPQQPFSPLPDGAVVAEVQSSTEDSESPNRGSYRARILTKERNGPWNS